MSTFDLRFFDYLLIDSLKEELRIDTQTFLLNLSVKKEQHPEQD
jgi:hypothetical protein